MYFRSFAVSNLTRTTSLANTYKYNDNFTKRKYNDDFGGSENAIKRKVQINYYEVIDKF